MKPGELIILWVGGLLSAALLATARAPTSDMADVAGHVVDGVALLLAIWTICGLVWLTIYRRSK
jgi:hypothetical protein